MILKCNSVLPNKEQAKKLNKTYRPGKQDFGLKKGNIYIAFGLYYNEGNPWVDIVCEETKTPYLHPVPLMLFDIIDGRPSKYWDIRMDKNGDMIMRPPSFYKEYYHDDLFEEIPEVVEDFMRIKSLLENEANTEFRGQCAKKADMNKP